MKAIQLIAHGTPGKFELRDLAEPQPRSGEVVVEVNAIKKNDFIWTWF